MDAEANVEAFHLQGTSSLIPLYHFNALAMHALLPEGGTVVDLGSGSAQYLRYLATCRPDLTIIGIDLSAPMVATGRMFCSEREQTALYRTCLTRERSAPGRTASTSARRPS